MLPHSLTLSRCRLGRRAAFCLMSLTLCVGATGCLREWTHRNDFGPPLQANIDRDQLISRINENILLVHNWECGDVRITSPAFVGSLNAHLSVQTPRNFRLRARTTITGEEADFGSNSERFWFWSKRAEPFVHTVRHEDLPRVQRRFNIPFQPDWLMEVMGVIPLDANQYTLLPPAQDGSLTLRADTLSPDGRPVVRVVRVDRFAHVVEHSLFDASGALVARALLSDHRLDPSSRAVLPHRIDLNWQQAGLQMALQLGKIDVNQLAPDSRIWEVPVIPDAPERDLGREIPPDGVGRVMVPQQGAVGRFPAQYAQLEEPPWESAPATAASVPSNEPPWADANEPPWDDDSPATNDVRWQPASFPPAAGKL